MLQLRPNCECCDADLPPDAPALVCTFECTFCPGCADSCLGRFCPNCGGNLTARPERPARLLHEHPASATRVVADHGHAQPLKHFPCPSCGVRHRTMARYPRALCPDCAGRATSLDGEPLDFYNESMSGGFVAMYAGTQRRHEVASHDHLVRVGALTCWAGEARFGGTVLVPFDHHHPRWTPPEENR